MANSDQWYCRFHGIVIVVLPYKSLGSQGPQNGPVRVLNAEHLRDRDGKECEEQAKLVHILFHRLGIETVGNVRQKFRVQLT